MAINQRINKLLYLPQKIQMEDSVNRQKGFRISMPQQNSSFFPYFSSFQPISELQHFNYLCAVSNFPYFAQFQQAASVDSFSNRVNFRPYQVISSQERTAGDHRDPFDCSKASEKGSSKDVSQIDTRISAHSSNSQVKAPKAENLKPREELRNLQILQNKEAKVQGDEKEGRANQISDRKRRQQKKSTHLPKERILTETLTRKDRLKRYLIKKRRRTYEKRVIYHCRKSVADERIRYKGRFVKKSEKSIEEI